MPLFVPQDGNPDQFLGYHDGLLHQGGAVLLEAVEDHVCRIPAHPALTLGGHRQWIYQCLEGDIEQKALYYVQQSQIMHFKR